ncbi:MAG TPA: hypothetical protein VH877_06555 [Polyangia bacterium]|jgi:hypothetical protein|nr:hypothetical protein [Polyangia bacterium]
MANEPLGHVTLVPPEERVRLTTSEIKQRYPDRWVVLVDVDDCKTQILGGVVYAHSPDRRALSPTVKSLRDTAVFWTGPLLGSLTLWQLEHVDSAV